MNDVSALIAHHATAATTPVSTSAERHEPAVIREYRRRAQVRLNVEGLPRGLRVAA